MNTRGKNKIWNTPKKMFFVFAFCIFLLYIKYAYLALSPTVYGKDMVKFAENRNTVKKTVKATRGTIYDNMGNQLALNVSSYTIILSLKKSKVYTKDDYVHDVDLTANSLAPILGCEADYIKEKLEQDKYQVELGLCGRGLTEITKDEIKALNLPGISFEESQKRFYPNGNFASYLIGYAKNTEVKTFDEEDNEIIANEIIGEMGIEAEYNKELSGTDGYSEYQVNRYGYKIKGTHTKEIAAKNGNDIYLTLDAGIQRFTESAVKDIADNYNPEWSLIAVMDAKTGDILASSSSPSFNPNIRDIVDYENPLLSKTYEPGSVMKTYTYMCSMENGVYNGEETFLSGNYVIGEHTIYDWYNPGWGVVNFDKGYEYSSNVGIANLLSKANAISKKQLKTCLKRYGFGKETDVELSNESKGSINFKYDVEFLNAGFGQGISTTAVQQLQALTMIANDGVMLKPHIVNKIVDSNTGKTVYERKIDKTKVVDKSITDKMKDLMYNVVHGTDAGTTGYPYKVEGFDVIAKTGTSQIYNVSTGTYSTGDNDYIFSVALMFPKNDPKIIIYGAMKKPTWGKGSALSKNVKALIQNISKYKNMFTEITEKKVDTYQIKSYINMDRNKLEEEFKNNGINYIIIGDGNKITKQSIKNGTIIAKGEKIILLTNGLEYKMPNITGFSKKEVEVLANLLNIKYKIKGYGYVTSQSIASGSLITNDQTLEVNLENKYGIGG